jgi:hypothetical protein
MNINEHTEHFGAEENNSHRFVSNTSDIIQYNSDLSNLNDIVLDKNVQDVHSCDKHILEYVIEHPLILPEHHTEHPDFHTTCSVDVHFQSLTQPDDIFSQS